MGLNKYSDLTVEETHLLKGLNRPLGNTYNDSVTYIGLSNIELPDSINWALKGAVTDVKDQGRIVSFFYPLIKKCQKRVYSILQNQKKKMV